jgi:C_GCAxxG_C_C family probable redox protein
MGSFLNRLSGKGNINQNAVGSRTDGKVDIQQIKKDAEALYRNGDYYCSEAIIATIREHLAPEMPIEAIAMGSGLPVGMGKAMCVCGAVSGAVVVIGYFFGRTKPRDKKVNNAMKLTKELHDYFQAENKVLCCRILTKDMTLGSAKHMEQCIAFTGSMAAKTAEIIARELKLEVVN